MVVSSPQCGEKTAFFSGFPLGGIHGQGILPVIPLELQGKKHQPFSITQPFNTSFQPVIRMGKPSILLLHVRCGGAACIYAERLCHRKWLMLFPWSSKGIASKMPWSVFMLKRLFRLREAGGRCNGIGTMYLRCLMPDRECLKL